MIFGRWKEYKMNTLGENIRILRKVNDKESQNKLAEKIHITQQAISMFEKGIEYLNLKHLGLLQTTIIYQSKI